MATYVRDLSARLVREWPDLSDGAASANYFVLSDWSLCVGPPVLYLASVYALRRAMRGRARPVDVPVWFQALHNAFLVGLSLYMAVGLLWQAWWVLAYGVVCNRVVHGALGLPVSLRRSRPPPFPFSSWC